MLGGSRQAEAKEGRAVRIHRGPGEEAQAEEEVLKIVAALCWYSEPIDFLTRCVRSLEGVVDHLVCCDGSWSLFPEGSHRSSRDEELAIWAAAHVARIPLTLHTPETTYVSQVAKRAALMALASEHGEWLMVVDADEYVTEAAPGPLRAALAATDAAVGEVSLINPAGFRGGLRRRLYRAGTTVKIVHSGYVYQGRQLLTGEPTLDASAFLTLTHDFANRGDHRNQQAREYLEARQATREEMWV